jgi:V-type H+-transporting ATPase subunit a
MEIELINVPSDSGAESGDDFAPASRGSSQAQLTDSRANVGRVYRAGRDPFPRCVPRPRWTPRLWRAESMTRVRLFAERESAPQLVRQLGRLGCGQFVDLNRGMQFLDRAFSGHIKDCEEVDRRLRALRSLLRSRGVAVPRTLLELEQPPEAGLESFAAQTLDELQQGSGRVTALEHSREELRELRHVLEYVKQLLDTAPHLRPRQSAQMAPVDLLGEEEEEAIDSSFVAGVGSVNALQSFERVLWRATRGNSLLCRGAEGAMEGRAVFVVWFTSGAVEKKIRKLCEAFSLSVYNVPPYGQLEAMGIEVVSRLVELEDVVLRSQAQLNERMQELASHLFALECMAAQVRNETHLLFL